MCRWLFVLLLGSSLLWPPFCTCLAKQNSDSDFRSLYYQHNQQNETENNETDLEKPASDKTPIKKKDNIFTVTVVDVNRERQRKY